MAAEDPTAPFLLARPGHREGLILGLACALLACLPVLLAVYPQMGDYPAHLARYHVMIDGSRSPFLAQFYVFEWKWTGNVGVDLLIQPLSTMMGLEPAGRLIAGAIPVLTGLGILAVEWSLRRRIGVGSLLAMAFIWSPSLLLGFVNFGLSLAAALFAFALWVELEGWRWRWVLFMPIGMLVWLCHLSGWGVLGLMVLGYEWSQRPALPALAAPTPLALPIIPLLLGGGTNGMMSYGALPQIYKYVIWTKAMRDQVSELDLVGLALILLLIVVVFQRKRFDGRLGWGAMLTLLGSLLIPRHLAGGDYADYRLIPVGLMLCCLSIDWRVPRWVLWLAPALFLARLGVTTATWARNSRETAQLLTALDHVPQGARIASAVLVQRDRWGMNTFEHIGAYAVLRRDALVNANFAMPHVHMLHLRPEAAGTGRNRVDPSQRILHWRGEPIDLANFAPAKGMDYLWYVGDEEPTTLPAGAQVIWRHGHALLARLANPPRAR